jgi:3-isopropylmalate/(R)-2-methylmalate dehydratase large subunit
MGKNIVEKILAKAVGRSEVIVGEYLPEVRSNRPMPCNVPNKSPRGLREAGVIDFGGLHDPKILKMVVGGHEGAGGGPEIGEARRKARATLKELGVPDENVLSMGQGGIEHVVAAEKCWALPGSIYFSPIDGHVTTNGALGALAIPLSYASVAYLSTGYTWIQVPEVVKIVLKGFLHTAVTARDIVEYLIGKLGPAGTPGQVMEWAGPLVDQMDMDARFTLCSNALFTCAWTAIVNPDEKTIAYVTPRTEEPFEPLVSDPDASYANVMEFDLSDLEPQIVPPPGRDKVFPVSAYEGLKFTRSFIGSCSNGRLDDLRLAAKILKGRKVHPGIELNITAATQNIYRQCVREGIIEIFSEAEAFIAAPCCGMCQKYNTPLGADEVCLSSATHNLPGRGGHDTAQVFLCSPATVAASAVTGELTDPRKFL